MAFWVLALASGLSLRGPCVQLRLAQTLAQTRHRPVLALRTQGVETEGLACVVPLSSEPEPHSELFDIGLALLPFAVPTLGFIAYDDILRLVTHAIDTLSPWNCMLYCFGSHRPQSIPPLPVSPYCR